MSTGSNSAIVLAKMSETEWGVKPGDEASPQIPDYMRQKISSSSFTGNRAELEDDSITSSRGITSVRFGNEDATATISGNLSHDNFDDLMESACMGAFTTDVLLSDGNIEKSFTFEIGRTDISQYEVWTGVQVNSMTVTSPTEGLTTIAFECNAKGQESINVTPQDATVTAQPVKEAMNHCGGTINYKGVPIAVITSVDFTLDNALENQFAWGNCQARDITFGRSRLTGTLTALMEDAVFMTDSNAETNVSIDFMLVDPAGATLKFNIPKAKLGSVDAPIEPEGATILSIPFTGQFDSVTGATLEITRSA